MHFQHEACSFPMPKVHVRPSTKHLRRWVASDKHVCLQCDSCLEGSSRGYLVASNERVCLQLETVVGFYSRSSSIWKLV